MLVIVFSIVDILVWMVYLVLPVRLEAFVGSMCHTIERTDRQGYPNC
jgi:hypothetical protein